MKIRLLFPSIVLAVVSFLSSLPASAAVRHWDGGGTTGFWDTAANWSNNVAPVNGDALFFPTNVTRLINTNRASANLTNVDSIRFTGDGFNIFSAPSINLTNGVTHAALAGASNALNVPFQLRRSQTWAVSGRNTLTVTSNVNWSGLSFTNDVSGTLIYNGNLNGAGAAELTKIGTGRIELNGPNNPITTVRVLDGTLQIDGALTATTISVSNGAAFTGSGSTTAFTCAGDFEPAGNSDTGILTMTGAGNAVFQPGARFFANVNGLVPGSDYDQFKTPSPPNLSGAQLVVLRSFSFAYSIGQKFIIVTNTGASAQTTTFTNLPQNARLTNSSIVFKISYSGGNGNDVELEVVDAPLVLTGVTRVWDGGGSNNFFSNPTNWVGDVAPQDGDSILFPTGLPDADRLATNDLSIRFNQLICASNGVTSAVMHGQKLILVGGIIATQDSGGLAFFNDVSFLNGGPIQVGGGNVSLNKVVDNGGADIVITGGLGRVLVNPLSSGVMTGAGGLVVSNQGGIEINNGHTYGGTTRFLRGAATITGQNSLGTTNNGSFVGQDVTLTVTSTRLLENFISLTGKIDFTATVVGNVQTGFEFSGTNSTFRTGPGVVVDFFGPWTGNGTVQLDQGEYVLENTHAVAGGITVANRGRIRVNGTGTSDILLAFSGGTLSGTGSVGMVRVSTSPLGRGRIEPGNGPGILTTSNLLFTGLTTNAFELNGLVPGTSHDQLRVNGTVNLGNATLELSLGFTPSPGDTFVIIDNDGADAVTGTFAGLAEGTTITNGATLMRLTYAGGTGNDVVLTVLEPPFAPTGVTRVWDAGGGNNNRNWNTAANWNNNTLPNRGDDLVFPASVPDTAGLRFVQNNLLAANSAYNRIWFGGRGGTWAIEGNALQLFAGIVATNATEPAGHASLANARVTLLASQTWSTTNMNLAVNTRTLLNGHTLTLASDTSGGIFLQNALLGPGTVRVASGSVNLFSDLSSSDFGVTIEGGDVLGGNSQFFGTPWQMSGGRLRPGRILIPGLQMTGGELNLANSPHANIDGDLTLVPAVSVVVGFDSATNTPLVVTGQVNLGNARLSAEFADLALLGTPLKFIEKTTAGAVTGTFAGLPEGGFISATNENNGLVTRFRISYVGGDGNDVTLTPVPPLPSGFERIWTGAGADALWPTAANWTANTSPANGDAVLFPVNAARRSNTNTSPGLILDAVDWRGSNYLHSGTLSLLSSLRHGAASGTNTINGALLASYGAQNWAVSNAAATLRIAPDLESLGGDRGTIEGLGPVTKIGAGTLDLENVSFRAAGGLVIDGGTVRLTDMDFNNHSSLTLQKGRIDVTGASAESTTATNGELNLFFVPNNDNGLLGGLMSFGGVTLGSNLTVTVHWTNGAFASIQTSQLDLGNARLNITFPPSLPASETVRIAQYTDGESTGQFANLPEGAITNFAGRDWEIHYAATIPDEQFDSRFVTLSPPVIAPRFTSIERLNNGDVIVRGIANPGATVNIEASETLETFTFLGSTVANGAGQFTFIDSAGGVEQRFYRGTLPEL